MLHDDKGIVLYCDASARPNPGKIGIGIHGYTYTINPNSKKTVNVQTSVTTDKGYLPRGNIGSASLVQPDEYIDFVESVLVEGTNNKGELLALFNSLNMVEQDDKVYKDIIIYTDSEYVRRGLEEWCESWKRNGWKRSDGTYVTNVTVWMSVYDRVLYLKSIGCSFEIKWVRGHNNDVGNTIADTLSVIGMNKGTSTNLSWSEKITSPCKGYWKNDITKHAFINFKRVYFNSVSGFNINGQYFQSEPGVAELVVGKRTPEAGFSIIRLLEPDPVIEMIRKKQYIVADDNNAIIMLKLDRVFDSSIYPYLQNYGEHCLLTNKQNLNLRFVDDKAITMEINPTNLSMRAIEAFNYIEELLEQFISLGTDNPIIKKNGFNSHDITYMFYNKEMNKNKKEKCIFNPDITNNVKNTVVKINEQYKGNLISIEIPYMLGIDILPRNNLKKLELDNPNIFLITWRESEETIRYATIIKCNSGIGIWSNFFADRIFLSTFFKPV